MDFQVNAIIVEKEIVSGNFLIEPHVSVKLHVTPNLHCLMVWRRGGCSIVFHDRASLQTTCLERLHKTE
jgi:hypothetical protein